MPKFNVLRPESGSPALHEAVLAGDAARLQSTLKGTSHSEVNAERGDGGELGPVLRLEHPVNVLAQKLVVPCPAVKHRMRHNESVVESVVPLLRRLLEPLQHEEVVALVLVVFLQELEVQLRQRAAEQDTAQLPKPLRDGGVACCMSRSRSHRPR